MPRVLLLASLILVGFPVPVPAAPLLLQYSGTLGTNSSLDATSLAGKSVTITAAFDSAADTDLTNGVGILPAAVTVDIQSVGVFQVGSSAGVHVYLADPSKLGGSLYAAGISNAAGSSGLIGIFGAAAPPFDADAPTPSALSGLVFPAPVAALALPLGGTQILTVGGISSTSSGAQISVPAPQLAVPEPSSFIIWTAAAAAGVRLRKCRRRG